MRNHFIFYEKFNLFYFYFLIMNTGFFSGTITLVLFINSVSLDRSTNPKILAFEPRLNFFLKTGAI
jgi:hypothetical protein